MKRLFCILYNTKNVIYVSYTKHFSRYYIRILLGVSLLQKPEKLYLENTNYVYAIKSTEPNIGSLRETFFLNQISESHTVTYPEAGDFLSMTIIYLK